MKFSSHISTIFVTPTDDAGTTKVQKQKKYVSLWCSMSENRHLERSRPNTDRISSGKCCRDGTTKQNMKCTLHETKHWQTKNMEWGREIGIDFGALYERIHTHIIIDSKTRSFRNRRNHPHPGTECDSLDGQVRRMSLADEIFHAQTRGELWWSPT